MSTPAGIWGLRLVALVLAFLAWAMITSEAREPESVKVLNTTIRYDIPNGFVLLEPPETARLTVRGKASSLRNLSPFQVDVLVDLTTAQKGTYSVPLRKENVTFLPDDLEIVSIEPSALSLFLDRELIRMLPVNPRLIGEPAAGAVAQKPTVNPPQIAVRGPESRLSSVAALSTTPINLDTHAIEFEERAGVISEDPTIQIIQNPVVTVRIPMLIPSAGEGEGG
jgi:YbbR domain-containing protein